MSEGLRLGKMIRLAARTGTVRSRNSIWHFVTSIALIFLWGPASAQTACFERRPEQIQACHEEAATIPEPRPDCSGEGQVQAPRSAKEISEKHFVRNLATDQRIIWTSPLKARSYRLKFILPFALSTIALIAADKAVAREVSEGPPGHLFDVSHGISYAGSVGVAGFAGMFYGVVALEHRDRARETGLLAGEALVDSEIVSEVLKLTTRRERPGTSDGRARVDDARGAFGSGGSSFPSGHAIASWTVASVFAERYPDKPLVKYSAYGVAGLVSIARVTGRNHFPSDVAVGSVLGYLIGRYVVRIHSRP
jgi:membrane-associated phospholipid phosphatase